MASPTPLHESLLAAPAVASERRPSSPWAYPLWAMLLTSVFVLYHTSVLLVWNMPGKGLLKSFHSSFLKASYGNDYFKGTRLTQSWGMFAPNPNRTNTFVHVYIEDMSGQVWDLEQDIWAHDRYPYIWYDRRGKVNRNIDGKKNYQRIYGAWACREWERTHGGEQAKSVTFIKRWTPVPQPDAIIANGGWDQWDEGPAKQKEQDTIVCKTAVQGTLPNELRERYGLELIDEAKLFKPVVQKTWWDKRERERKIAEIEAKRGKPLIREEPDDPEDEGPQDDQ